MEIERRIRWYQQPLHKYLVNTPSGRAIEIAHRRWGKDEVVLAAECELAHKRIGTYWHCLPEYAQARKALWTAVNAHTGKRRIDEAFPKELRESTNESEMFIRFKSGSTWQLIGSDRYDSTVGSGPVFIGYSEWALSNPAAWGYHRPMLEENGGGAAFITTPRGNNHAKRMFDMAMADMKAGGRWFAERSTIEHTKALTAQQLDEALKEYIALYGEDVGLSLYEQEYLCSWNTAIVGAILGRYIDRQDRKGLINDEVLFDPHGAAIEVSSDIGFRDTATWWFWQRRIGGFSLLGCLAGTGLDAQDWIVKLKEYMVELEIEPRMLGKIWLPHDAKAKTFQSKHSAMEQFIEAFGVELIGVIPQAKKQDQINAARTVAPRCEFHAARCADGLDGLRNWRYEWNEELRVFSSSPVHDWASHFGDGFAYGCQVMQGLPAPEKPRQASPLKQEPVSINDLWLEHEKGRGGEARI